jgi:hypothetical protein
MTPNEFHTAFVLCAPQYDWKESTASGALRGYRDVDGETLGFCPITALYFCESGEFIPINSYNECLDKLGLTEGAARYIAQAADLKPESVRFPKTAGKKLYHDLEEANVPVEVTDDWL